jgi:hypothetical protein
MTRMSIIVSLVENHVLVLNAGEFQKTLHISLVIGARKRTINPEKIVSSGFYYYFLVSPP